MPSPFPGMNPFIEQADHWQDFHSSFLHEFRNQLESWIGPDYIVQLEQHVYIHELPTEPRQFLGRPDVSPARSGSSFGQPAGLDILEPPTEVLLTAWEVDVERVVFVEVRDRRGRELVTVIELLSPSNKRPGDDRLQDLIKRRKVFRNPAHLVEIDLLRGWEPMPAEGRPGGDYSVLVSRAERRPVADFWPIGLRNRLPTIPIPLRRDDPDQRVGLHSVLDRAYDNAGYKKYIYEESPEPSLRPEDAEWAAQFVPKPA